MKYKIMHHALAPLWLTAVTAIALAGCTAPAQQQGEVTTAYATEDRLPGDSATYGLACEGCTDSVIVYLPYTGGDPDTLSIIAARQQGHVMGRPDIGDELAIVINSEDSTEAALVINLDRLKGEWCYQVVPTLNLPTPAPGTKLPPLPDSLRQKWMQPREYGMDIRREYSVIPIGTRAAASDGQTPAVYPALKRYREWHLLNGRLILSQTATDSLGQREIVSSDTADITLLQRDSLVLRFADKEQGYYRRKSN